MSTVLLPIDIQRHSAILAALRLYYEYLNGAVQVSVSLQEAINPIASQGDAIAPLTADDVLWLGNELGLSQVILKRFGGGN